MRRVLLAASLAASLGAAIPVASQAQAVTSALSGLALPEGTKLDKGFLTRAAAKADLDMTAKGAGATLGSRYEVYRLGPIGGAMATFANVKTLAEGAGWTLTPSADGKTWGWLDKGAARLLANFYVAKDGAWLYLAEVAQRAPAVATTPASAPSANTPANTPAKSPASTPPSQGPTNAPVATTLPSAPLPSGPRRFQFTRSEFDDGWVAVEQPDYVQVTKGALTAYLFYRVTMTEQMRPPVTDVIDYFWNRDGRPRFDLQNANKRREESSYPPLEYVEGDVTDRASGKRGFAGMFVSRNNGGALNIMVVAPDKGAFYQAFPKPGDLERMMNYNKFAVAPGDLPGYWSESSGAFAQMYYVQSGNYAGMNAASVSAQFWIAPDGTYRSMHKGATGMVGNQKVFQQEYRGSWKLTGNWEMTMTNRFEGKTDTFLMQFEAVKGGRLLRLTDKQYQGVQYHLGVQ